MRLIDADALIEKCGDWYVEEGTESGFIGTLKNLLANEPTIQPEKAQLSHEGATSDQPVATDTNVGSNSEIPNSSDCISRQKAIDALQNCRKHCIDPFDSYHIDIQDAENQLSKVPTAQPQPKEGHWIEGGIYRDVIECYCSECGQLMTTAATVRMNYCPNCGAHMKGEQNETD